MDSNYVKAIDEEIKKRKAENELQFNLANIQSHQNDPSLMNENEPPIQNFEIDPASEEIIKNQNNLLPNDEEENDFVNEGIKSLSSNEHRINFDEKINDSNKIMTMNSFHLCQCCNKEFDTKVNIPYVLKCNHFFCKTCLENYFTDEEGIKCPIDGLVGKTLDDIQILSDFNQNNNTMPVTSHGINMKNSIDNKKKIQNNTFNANVNNMLNDENTNFMINTYDEKEDNFIDNNENNDENNDDNNDDNYNNVNINKSKTKEIDSIQYSTKKKKSYAYAVRSLLNVQ